MERISTGIAGLDSATGGFLRGRSALVAGRSGTGKTIMALQFAAAACAAGRGVTYVAVRERREDLIEQASAFGWPIEDYEVKKLISILPVRDLHNDPTFHTYGQEGGFNPLLEMIGQDQEVVVIDNLGALALDMTLLHFRQQIDYLLGSFSSRNVTTLVVCDEGMVHRFGEVVEQVFDVIIRLGKKDSQFVDRRERQLEIAKMRFTDAPIDPLPFRIGKSGIELL
ncbi:MAG: ATPase domain-containing protein [Methanomassiliicoccales archaeon]|jgi:circadian clock protein KaiC